MFTPDKNRSHEAKASLKMHRTLHFVHENSKKILWGGNRPCTEPTRSGEGIPLSKPTLHSTSLLFWSAHILWLHVGHRLCSYSTIQSIQICQIRSIQSDEKERVHRDAHYYVIISHNTSVPMIGHSELATGTLTSYASWA